MRTGNTMKKRAKSADVSGARGRRKKE